MRVRAREGAQEAGAEKELESVGGGRGRKRERAREGWEGDVKELCRLDIRKRWIMDAQIPNPQPTSIAI